MTSELSSRASLSLLEFRTTALLCFFICQIFLLLSVEASAEEHTRKSIDIPQASFDPKIDGDLGAEEWQQARRIDDLHQNLPTEGALPTEKTHFYIMYDSDALYVAVHSFDSEPEKIRATQLAQGKSIAADDTVYFTIDTFLNRKTGYIFALNPNGVRWDALHESPFTINDNWDGIWFGEARLVEDGWTAEFKIPFKTINFDNGSSEWGLALGRKIKRREERIAWTSLNNRNDTNTAGSITGIKDISQGKGLDIVPSLILKSKFLPEKSAQLDALPSLDVFYKITPSLTSVLTLNTDFSATDVDDRIVNLSRFSVFYPEKRAFFLHDADIFGFGGLSDNGLPFHSRSIGLGSDGTPVDIIAGIKTTGRIGDFNLGVLDIVQDGHDGIKKRNLFTARVSANILSESSVGFILTNGDPNSNEDNTLFGADFSYGNSKLLEGKYIVGDAWFQHSETSGVDGDTNAYGANVGFSADTGFSAEIVYRRLGENFNPALGFVNWTGITEREFWGSYAIRPSRKNWRYFQTEVLFHDTSDNSGRLQSRLYSLTPAYIENGYGDKGKFSISRSSEVLYNSFEIVPGVIIPPGSFTFDRGELWISTSDARPFSAEIATSSGRFFDGRRNGIVGIFQWRMNKHIFLTTNYRYNNVSLPGGHFIARLSTFGADIAINSKWSVLNYVQYDNISDSAGLNSKIRWTPEPGKEVYFVGNYNADIDEDGIVSTKETELILKGSMTFRF